MDQTIVLTGVNSVHGYPQPLRRVKYHDAQTGKTFNFLTDNFAIPAQTVADLNRYRWQLELFFKRAAGTISQDSPLREKNIGSAFPARLIPRRPAACSVGVKMPDARIQTRFYCLV